MSHLPLLARIQRVIDNARRLGIDAFHTSVALDLVAPIAGRTWTAICCSCLDRTAHETPDAHIYRVADSRAGGCMLCPYFGRDTLVASLMRDMSSEQREAST